VPVPVPGMRHWTVRCVPRTCGTRATQEVDVHAALLAAGGAVSTVLQIAPAGVGVIAFGVLLALLVVAYAFRNAGNRN